MSDFFAEFISASVLMGLGIGIDAALATSLQARYMSTRRLAVHWVVGISLTHTLFPMVGYLLSYVGLQYMPFLSPIVGLLAFVLIAQFLYGELRDDPHSSDEYGKRVLVSLGLILAVSWDALWSGPAKSAQVIGWPDMAVWASFILVGITVAFITSLSLVIARSVSYHESFMSQPSFRLVAQWLQYGVISYFGWLALIRYTFGIQISWSFILLCSLVFMAIILYGKQYLHSRTADA